MQTCPALAKAVCGMTVRTLSMSASGITITGALEPSSIVTFLIPACLQMRSPMSRLPVKLILRTRGSDTSASPISAPEPVTQCTASAGTPASSSNSTRRSAISGVSLAGLTTTAFPPARAGPTLWQTRCSGKLNGVTAATTPQGTRMVKPNLPLTPGPPSSGMTSPSSRFASSADR